MSLEGRAPGGSAILGRSFKCATLTQASTHHPSPLLRPKPPPRHRALLLVSLAAGVVVTNTLCANYEFRLSSTDQCSCDSDWADRAVTVDVQLCEEGHGGSFYIHKFDSISSCPSALCVQEHPRGVNGNRRQTLADSDFRDLICLGHRLEQTVSVFSFRASGRRGQM